MLHELTGHRGPVTVLSFVGPEPRLVSGGQDGAALVWAVTDLLRSERPPEVTFPADELEAAWNDLGSTDTAAATFALQKLSRAQSQAVPLVRERVLPVDADAIARWLKALNDDRFPARDRAGKELMQLGRSAEPYLRRALAAGPSPQARRALKVLLHDLTEGGPRPDDLRAMRAAELLETFATPEALRVLDPLAGGAPEAERTRQAKAARERVRRGYVSP